MRDEFLWSEIYRPKTVGQLILPDRLKNVFKQFVAHGNIPNLLLTGGPGTGKTSVAKAMLNELDSDFLVINGSLSGNIDTLRYDIKDFASTLSFNGNRKYVILDEADYLNANSMQPALRNFMEEYSAGCGFILTCNYPSRIIKELQSRCSVIDFSFEKSEVPQLAGDMFKRVCTILDTEKIEYDKKVLIELIKKHFPDFRKTINELQLYSNSGKIDTGILVSLKDDAIKVLIGFMKEKNFTEVRKWVSDNSDMETTEFYTKLYENAVSFLKTPSIPHLVLILAKYQYQDAFAANKEINTAAFLVECMVELEFK